MPGPVRSYLSFIERSVLFRKPISCFFALFSFLIPLAFLLPAIQYRDIIFSDANLLFASILFLLILIIAGIFGGLIWWHRRLRRDVDSSLYGNFRAFLQTLGEWTGTLYGLIICLTTIVLYIFLRDDNGFLLSIILGSLNLDFLFLDSETIFSTLVGLLMLPIRGVNLSTAIFGLCTGFIIILATRIFLIVLDFVYMLLLKIWNLIKGIVLYYYRCIIRIHRTIEQNSTIWLGVVWLFAILVVIAGLVLCYLLTLTTSLRGEGFGPYLMAIIPVIMGLGLMAFLVLKWRN